MRIAMVGWEFPPAMSGGLGTHCYEITKVLAALGVEIDFYMPKTKEKVESTRHNLKIIQVSEADFGPYAICSKEQKIYLGDLASNVKEYNAKTVCAVIKNNQLRHYDLIHCHDWLTAETGMELKKRTGLPYVQTIHATEYDRNSCPWEYVADIEQRAVKNADQVIAVSNRTKNMLVKYYNADPDKISVIYNGIDKKQFEHNGRYDYFKKLLGKNTNIVLFLGRITEQKGPLYFIRAAKEVVKYMPNTVFIMAGGGDLLPASINKSIELGLSESIMFTGKVSWEQAKILFALADVFVMPSTSEPFGITPLEAVASGTPVIISKTSGVSEVLNTAIKIDFWDVKKMAWAVMGLLKYKRLRNVMLGLGEAELKGLTWDKVAVDTIALYKRAVGG